MDRPSASTNIGPELTLYDPCNLSEIQAALKTQKNVQEKRWEICEPDYQHEPRYMKCIRDEKVLDNFYWIQNNAISCPFCIVCAKMYTIGDKGSIMQKRNVFEWANSGIKTPFNCYEDLLRDVWTSQRFERKKSITDINYQRWLWSVGVYFISWVLQYMNLPNNESFTMTVMFKPQP